jgi:hypothetical protein
MWLARAIYKPVVGDVVQVRLLPRSAAYTPARRLVASGPPLPRSRRRIYCHAVIVPGGGDRLWRDWEMLILVRLLSAAPGYELDCRDRVELREVRRVGVLCMRLVPEADTADRHDCA